MNENYIRGFKEALEWVLHKEHSCRNIEELTLEINRKYAEILEKHMANLD